MNNMQVILHGTIKPDGSLELNHPLDLPPGEVRVTVQPLETPPQSKEDIRTFLERIRADQKMRGHAPQTREEIDADLQALRDEAEEETQEIENIQTNQDCKVR